MKIGLDYHNVIDALPIFFSELSKLFVQAGHEIHVITGKEYSDELIQELKNLNITYTHIFSVITHCKEKGVEIWYTDNNNPWMDEKIWDKVKSEYCTKHNIDIMLDDSTVYGTYFTTPYVCFNVQKKEI